MSESNGEHQTDQENLEVLMKLMAELRDIEKKMADAHEQRLKDLRRMNLIAALIMLVGPALLGLAAVLNYLASQKP